MPDKDGPPVVVRHKACDHAVLPELACPECGEWVTATDMEAHRRRLPVPVA
jgi:hypothetical protein